MNPLKWLDIRRAGLGLLPASALAFALSAGPGPANAAPDIDGAVDAFVSTPLDVVGDGIGSLGLISSAGVAILGDLAALIDDNEYTRVALRGLVSSFLRRAALGTSQMSTGALEGMRNEDFASFPEGAAGYLEPADMQGRIGTIATGVGCLALGAVDLVANPALVLVRLPGLAVADDIARFQVDTRDQYVGTAK